MTRRGVFLLSRRRSVPRLVRRLSRRHPEFERPMTWADVERVCARERIVIRTRTLPPREQGWLVRVDDYVTIRLSRTLNAADRLWTALHELAHYFTEDMGEVCMFADDGSRDEVEEFCDIFAWYCCDSGAREFLDRREGVPF